MLGLERDAWSMAKRPSQAINEYCPLSLQEVVTPENKQSIGRCHPYSIKSASQAVPGRMQLSLHATRPTPHGASRLVQAMPARSVKPDALRPGIIGMRGTMVIRLRPCMA